MRGVSRIPLGANLWILSWIAVYVEPGSCKVRGCRWRCSIEEEEEEEEAAAKEAIYSGCMRLRRRRRRGRRKRRRRGRRGQRRQLRQTLWENILKRILYSDFV
jgi:hypothetical protein